MFILHPQLARDTFFIADMPLCRALLMNNTLYPWVILVPRIEAASELIDLAPNERHRLMDEIAKVSHIMRIEFAPDKLNIAALGNQVPQLHIHIIARYKNDAAWPNPVWGKTAEPYANPEPVIQRLEQVFLPACQ
jgi:diadenosine tetraphosphate (Ap4A) HIT family hydrolase